MEYTGNGTCLKSKDQWKGRGENTNELGFNVIPSGSLKKKDLGKAAHFWSSDEEKNNRAYAMEFVSHLEDIFFGRYDFQDGLSVRCIADSTTNR